VSEAPGRGVAPPRSPGALGQAPQRSIR